MEETKCEKEKSVGRWYSSRYNHHPRHYYPLPELLVDETRIRRRATHPARIVFYSFFSFSLSTCSTSSPTINIAYVAGKQPDDGVPLGSEGDLLAEENSVKHVPMKCQSNQIEHIHLTDQRQLYADVLLGKTDSCWKLRSDVDTFDWDNAMCYINIDDDDADRSINRKKTSMNCVRCRSARGRKGFLTMK